MNVVRGSIFAEICPELNIDRISKNGFEDYRLFPVGGFRKSETDIDAEDVHAFPPYKLPLDTNSYYNLTKEKSKKTISLSRARFGLRIARYGLRVAELKWLTAMKERYTV